MTMLAELQDLSRRRHERPLPRVSVVHGPSVPGGVLRVLAALAVGGLVLLTAARTSLLPDLALSAALVLAMWTAVRPGRVPSHLAVVLSAAVLLGAQSAPFDPAVLWLAPLGFLTVRLGWWAEHTSWTGRVEWAALRATAGRDLTICGATVVLGAAAWAAAAASVGVLVVLGGIAVVAIGWAFLPR
ncbi:hypothetical protein GCM10023216_17090 [Isoptericola chiayiensis]|uniref:Integral membrane protein n=1 Tax=Isoptericola chiayiensis TaxID=579446 RepID=A0ABP8YD32_9MICO|nr:hypothetical protein [Isoptericola chiayiensis]NOV99937.1 hypothetical protein [Isoptericola chiayiensis]